LLESPFGCLGVAELRVAPSFRGKSGWEVPWTQKSGKCDPFHAGPAAQHLSL